MNKQFYIAIGFAFLMSVLLVMFISPALSQGQTPFIRMDGNQDGQATNIPVQAVSEQRQDYCTTAC